MTGASDLVSWVITYLATHSLTVAGAEICCSGTKENKNTKTAEEQKKKLNQ